MPIAKFTLPKPPRSHDFGTDIVMLMLLPTLNTVTALVCLLLQLCYTWKDESGHSTAVELTIGVLRPLVMTALSLRWHQRLGEPVGFVLPPSLRLLYRELLVCCVDLCDWYQRSMLPVNYALYAIGSAVILISNLLSTRGS